MKTKILILTGALGVSLLAAAASSPADGADGNRTLSVRAVVHASEPGGADKPLPGPSGLVKGHAVLSGGGTAPEPRIVRTPKGGTEK